MLREGTCLHDVLCGFKGLSHMTLDQIAVGEESGRLDQVMERLSERSRDESESAIKRCLLFVTISAFLMAAILVMWKVIGFWINYAERIDSFR